MRDSKARKRRALAKTIYEGRTCHYCPDKATTRDHIVPASLGGPTTKDNLVPACRPCNEARADRGVRCPCAKCRLAWGMFGDRHQSGRTAPPATRKELAQ